MECIQHRGQTDYGCRYCLMALLSKERDLSFCLRYDSPEELNDVGLSAYELQDRGKKILAKGLPCIDVYVHVARWGDQ